MMLFALDLCFQSTRISTDTKGRKSSSSLRAERSKQNARECRVRKKLRYQCLEETVVCREKAVISLRNELSQVLLIILFRLSV